MTTEPGGPAARPSAGPMRITFRRWRIDGEAVRIHGWPGEDEELAYDDRSGHTHFLGPIEAWMARRLMQQPLGAADLADELAAGLGVPADPQLVERVEAVLAQFEVQTLAERVLA